MHNVTLKEIAAVEALLSIAKTEKVGMQLTAILRDINPEDYNKVCIVTDKQTLREPVIRGTQLIFTDRQSGQAVDIDDLKGQFRWDAVSCIWNEFKENTEEIENL